MCCGLLFRGKMRETDEWIGGTPTPTWVFRACVVQGTQQIYVTALWYWGAYLTNFTTAGGQISQLITSGPMVTAITTPVAVLLWAIGIVLLLGLPNFYRSSPGRMPSFYPSIYRRKIVLVSISSPNVSDSRSYWLIVVLHRRTNPELLAFCTVRSELEVPLVEHDRVSMDDSTSRRLLFRRGLGIDALGPRTTI